MPDGRYGNHSGRELLRAGSQEGAFEELKEIEVANVAGAKLSLEAVVGSAFGCGHDASIEDRDVESLALLQE